MGEKLLAGIRVVDLTTVVVGPAATLRLSDYGAEIIKVEAPEGDLMRVIGGPSHSGELSGKFMHFNRSKRFACLNLKMPGGADDHAQADRGLRCLHLEHPTQCARAARSRFAGVPRSQA
jgi:crotonobetainyl-CoA:carnitine CoA-transferase CaiB-like acyl-CoA transferase